MNPANARLRRPLVGGLLVLATACAPAAQVGTATPVPSAATPLTSGASHGRVVHPSLRGVDSMLAAAYPAGGPGAAVIVARGDSILLRNAYGLANVELGVPLSPDHVFRTGSITKQFTAVATLLLVQEGRISLQDEITRFFPDWPTQGHRITVEHLLTHTSGIRSYTSMQEFAALTRRDHTLAELLGVFRDQPMDFAPGTSFLYNNSGYLLLGAIIEQVSGERYADFIRTRLFQPLGMEDTRFDETEPLLRGRVTGYARTPAGEIRNAPYLSMTIPHAAGSVVSTVDDLLRWQRALASRRILSEDLWTRAFHPFQMADGRSSGYGYGWFIGTAGGERTVEHGGDINGFATEGIWVPSADLHVVVLSNVMRNFANPTDPALAAIERLLSAAPAAVGADADRPVRLDDYVGVYRISENDVRIVRREGDRLVSVRGSASPQAMRHVRGDQFAYLEGGSGVIFDRDAGGKVSAMRIRTRIGPDQRPSPRISEDPAAPAAAEPPVASVEAAVLDQYVGEYRLAPEFIITIRRSADGISAQATGQQPVTLVPRSATRFTIREVPASIEFRVGEDRQVTGLVLEQDGRRMEAVRVR